MTVSLGLFGGTFDPIHIGHLDVARAACRALALREVWLVPARMPPHRGQPRASAAHRFAMTALAIDDQPDLRVSDLDMDIGGPSYTVETLARLRQRGVDTRSVCLVTGADAFKDITSWKDYARLLDECHFVVVSRPGASAAGLRAALPMLADRMVDARGATTGAPRIHLVDVPTAPVSSTEIRRAAAFGSPVAGLVPDRVAVYIDRHGLYASGRAADNDSQGGA